MSIVDALLRRSEDRQWFQRAVRRIRGSIYCTVQFEKTYCWGGCDRKVAMSIHWGRQRTEYVPLCHTFIYYDCKRPQCSARVSILLEYFSVTVLDLFPLPAEWIGKRVSLAADAEQSEPLARCTHWLDFRLSPGTLSLRVTSPKGEQFVPLADLKSSLRVPPLSQLLHPTTYALLRDENHCALNFQVEEPFFMIGTEKQRFPRCLP
jgi:hypothetical protein